MQTLIIFLFQYKSGSPIEEIVPAKKFNWEKVTWNTLLELSEGQKYWKAAKEELRNYKKQIQCL